MDELIAQTLDRIYTDHADNHVGLWQALEENGLTRAWVPENLGGTGLALSDGFELIQQTATKFTAVPFAETLMAAYLLSAAKAETPDGKITLCVSTNGAVAEVPFATTSDLVLRLTENKLALFELTDVNEISNVGSDPVATIDFSKQNAISTNKAPDWLNAETYNQLGATVRSAQLCGAMQCQLELTLEHTSTREQFGRTLTKFQAVQHLLAEMASELAMSSAALEGAIQTISLDSPPELAAVACAKTKASEAADIVTKNAHQAHGAIGFTGEYALGQFSRRLWQWREDFGNEFYWSRLLGEKYSRAASGGLTEDVFGAVND